MPSLAFDMYHEAFGADVVPRLFVYDRGGHSRENIKVCKKKGIKKIGIQPKGRARWQVRGQDRKIVMSERGKMEGKIGTLKNSYGFNKPRQRSNDTVLVSGHRSILSFNLNKFMKHSANAVAVKVA
jgi:hypothetical protein